MNSTQTEANWNTFKAEIMKQWGELTDDEVNKTKGNLLQLAGKVQEKYGMAKEDAHKELNSLLNNINQKLS